jgi:hypothetical protein
LRRADHLVYVARSGLQMTAGYSGTPQARKLGLKPGHRVWFDAAPAGWALQDPPADLSFVAPPAPVDLLIAFFTAASQFGPRLPALTRRIFPDGALWIAWPRRAAGHESDITDTTIRGEALPLGVVDVKVAAIDEDWSGLRVVWRKEHRGRGV